MLLGRLFWASTNIFLWITWKYTYLYTNVKYFKIKFYYQYFFLKTKEYDIWHFQLLNILTSFTNGAVVAVIISVSWIYNYLCNQCLIITTKVVSLNPTHDEVYSIQLISDKFVSDLRQVNGFPRVLWFPLYRFTSIFDMFMVWWNIIFRHNICSDWNKC